MDNVFSIYVLKRLSLFELNLIRLYSGKLIGGACGVCGVLVFIKILKNINLEHVILSIGDPARQGIFTQTQNKDDATNT